MLNRDDVANAIEQYLTPGLYGYEPLLVKKLRHQGFTNDQIVQIVEAVGSTCKECWDADYGCSCWRDD